ncbi:hypothetical protein SAMN02746095_00376 [Acidocella aminolytica 101 = DSM 11237]|uniref:Uncharacterized protein n=1 Tax=Acidocella aminolytica 101 = DSM 11237 TaxID=1120923 RepID=A0A0D6PC95_9PROT|nr:hypothetical protein [Acidocella aminolytica]GAN79380.1 hypothetical protein Aam_020_144 [Acidocella aminolytica 101 = DSM 11237]SHE39775.1 hypothetical protein SAMN02746095_00376 [Acidocella aminolytica 101 = DSM 11237]
MKILTAAALGCLLAGPTWARQDPKPKPSGIVIHLFGPAETSTPNVTTNGKGQIATDTSSASDQSGQNPSWGDVLHQMFVTGDPAQDSKPSFPTGRQGSH